MREGGSLTTLAGDLKVLAKDVRALVELGAYSEALVKCLLEPYDRGALADFPALDNICRDLRTLIGGEGTFLLWEARKQAFEEAWNTVEAAVRLDGLDWRAAGVHGDRGSLRDVLLNVLSKRTPDDVHEQIEIGLK